MDEETVRKQNEYHEKEKQRIKQSHKELTRDFSGESGVQAKEFFEAITNDVRVWELPIINKEFPLPKAVTDIEFSMRTYMLTHTYDDRSLYYYELLLGFIRWAILHNYSISAFEEGGMKKYIRFIPPPEMMEDEKMYYGEIEDFIGHKLLKHKETITND